jgi:hypothetical protein
MDRRLTALPHNWNHSVGIQPQRGDFHPSNFTRTAANPQPHRNAVTLAVTIKYVQASLKFSDFERRPDDNSCV